MTLQAELDAFMADVRTKVPPEVLAPIEAFYIEDIKPRLAGALSEGQVAPDFVLPDAAGRPVSLADLRRQGPVIVSFYRGAWCPFCNLELRALQQSLPAFRAAGATLVAISPEKPDYSMPLIEREQLAFPVLSDSGNTVARQFGLVFELEGEVRRLSRDVFGVDLPAFNGDQSWTLPVPATYLIDTQGTVRYAFVDPDFRHRVEPEKLLELLR